MSQVHRWISLAKAHLLLLLCLHSGLIIRGQEIKTTPSDMTVKNVGTTGANFKSSVVTSSTPSTGDSGVTETSHGILFSTETTTTDIQPTLSSIFQTESPNVTPGETTPVLPSPDYSVLSPLSSVLPTSELLSSIISDSSHSSIISSLTESTFSIDGTVPISSQVVNMATASTLTSYSSSSDFINPTSSSIYLENSATVVQTEPTVSSSPPFSSSTGPDASETTTSFPSTTSNTSHSDSPNSPSPPHGSSSGETTPAGISTTKGTLANTTKPSTNSSNAPGEEDRLHKGQDKGVLSTPAIIGIGFGAAATALVVIGVVLLMLKKKAYRRNKQDSTNFWDDNVTLSYINSHAEFPKDLDAEMMSLDDDSFLNSLDSMTFANLWATDTAKHTNF